MKQLSTKWRRRANDLHDHESVIETPRNLLREKARDRIKKLLEAGDLSRSPLTKQSAISIHNSLGIILSVQQGMHDLLSLILEVNEWV